MLGPHTVEVINPGTKPTDYGTGTQDDWDAATTVPVNGCSVQPFAAPAYTVDRKNITTRWTVWMPAGSPVSGRSRVRYDGEVYEVDGDPQRWGFPPADHVVVNLRRSQG